MNVKDRIYISLCTLFSILIVTGNLIYQKFVILSFFSFYSFEISIGAILYPVTFLITGIITEFYGKEKAEFCIKLAIISNILIALIILGMDKLSATKWSKVDNETFHNIFGLHRVAFIGSLIACYVSQKLDIIFYLWISKITKAKRLWLRSIGSTAISFFIDTCIVISFMAFFNILPIEYIERLIINTYLFKISFIIFSTPLFYIAANIIKKII